MKLEIFSQFLKIYVKLIQIYEILQGRINGLKNQRKLAEAEILKERSEFAEGLPGPPQ